MPASSKYCKWHVGKKSETKLENDSEMVVTNLGDQFFGLQTSTTSNGKNPPSGILDSQNKN